MRGDDNFTTDVSLFQTKSYTLVFLLEIFPEQLSKKII
jgi:hypothetical protein